MLFRIKTTKFKNSIKVNQTHPIMQEYLGQTVIRKSDGPSCDRR